MHTLRTAWTFRHSFILPGFFPSPPLPPPPLPIPCAGDVHEAQVWPDEESLRTERPLRLRDRAYHIQLDEQALPICVYGYGQSATQIHRVQ